MQMKSTAQNKRTSVKFEKQLKSNKNHAFQCKLSMCL